MKDCLPEKSSLRIAILGRPNVGKSTLFNRLTGRKLAIVHNKPGVTRDWREAQGSLADLSFYICDTAGLDGFEEVDLKDQILQQTEALIRKSDLLLLMTDAREGVTSSEKVLAQQVRLTQKPIILLANKCEGKEGRQSLYEMCSLGLGDPIPLSAEHGEGLDELYYALAPYFSLPEKDEPFLEEDLSLSSAFEEEKEKTTPLRLAIIGRPNVGKSTLINSLLGESRVLTGDQPGVTRDAVGISWAYKGRDIHLVDTAGLRRTSRVDESLEKLAACSSFEEIRYAQVAVLVLDAHDPLNKQDLTLASHVIEEGRALVIALNKWDAVDQKNWNDVLQKLGQALSQVKGIPLIPISALKNKNLDKLMSAVLEMDRLWRHRIPTARLNQWLERVIERHPPPLSRGKRIHFKYATQIKTRPPTFALFVSKPVEVPDAYMRYLMTSLRESFDLPGVPLRLLLRKGKNPYVSKKNK